ncbi:MAG: DUF3467 domain-containing protein [Candidatus Kuenenia sp.]|nr:DUF3467 domain-containing protein [Candidatus Kuenenia hertensis]
MNKNVQTNNHLVGQYANAFKIGHNAFEFVIDFGQSCSKNETFHTRIVSSPYYANVLLKILRESVERYEQTFGAIPGGSGENE